MCLNLIRRIKNQNPRLSGFSNARITELIKSRLKSFLKKSDDDTPEVSTDLVQVEPPKNPRVHHDNSKPHIRGLRPTNTQRPRSVSPEMQRRIERRRISAMEEAASQEILYPGYAVVLPTLEVPPVEPQSPQPIATSNGNYAAEGSFLDHILKPVQIYPFKPNPGSDE